MINPKHKIHNYNNAKNIEMKHELCPQLRACAEAMPLVYIVFHKKEFN